MELKNYFAQDSQGNSLPGANYYVYLPGTTTITTIYDADGVAIANPSVSDSNGLIQFAAPNGRYDLRVVLGSRDYTIEIQCNDALSTIDRLDVLDQFDADLANATDPAKGAGMVGFLNSFPGSVSRTTAEKGSDTVGIGDLGGIPEAISKVRDAAAGDLPISSPNVFIPAGQYTLTSTLNVGPYQRLRGDCGSVINYSPNTGSAIRYDGEFTLSTNPTIRHTFSGPVLEKISLIGSGRLNPVTGLDIGNISNDLIVGKMLGGLGFRDLVITDFDTGINYRPSSTYINRFNDIHIERVSDAFTVEDSVNFNSGERNSVIGAIFAGCLNNGVNFLSNGQNWHFDHVSFDFIQKIGIYFGPNTSNNNVFMSNCHIEGVIKMIQSDSISSGDYRPFVSVKNSYILPVTNNILPENLPVIYWQDNVSTQYDSVFKGTLNISFEDVSIFISRNNPSAEYGLYMCDDTVRVKYARNVVMADDKWAFSRRLNRNYGSRFEREVNGVTLREGAGVDWVLQTFSGVNVTVDNTDTFQSATNALKITATSGPGSCTILSRPIEVQEGQSVMPVVAAKLNGISGTVTGVPRIYWIRSGQDNISSEVTTIVGATSSGFRALNLTTSVEHGLSQNDVIEVWDNLTNKVTMRRVSSIISPTQFQTGNADPVGVPTSLRYRPLIKASSLLSRAEDSSSDWSSLYSATIDGNPNPAFTGDKSWWCRPSGLGLANAPGGVTHAVVGVNISGLAIGDTMLLGEIGAQVFS